jgi:hypothetical protein
VREAGDLAGVSVPARLRGIERGLVAGLRGGEDPNRDQDMPAKQVSELRRGSLPVERLGRFANVLLVLEKSLLGRRGQAGPRRS